MPSHLLLFALTASIALLTPAYLGAQQKELAIPDTLSAAIQKAASGAALVTAHEVDATACAPVGQAPGLVRADFNGDGRDDYAALLKTKETGKETIWEGKKLREARFSFVLFLDDGNGGYKPRVVRRYTDFVPTAVVLDLQPAGNVRHRETHKTVKLANPGVMLSFCEKSATTYFIAAGKIRSIPVAD